MQLWAVKQTANHFFSGSTRWSCSQAASSPRGAAAAHRAGGDGVEEHHLSGSSLQLTGLIIAWKLHTSSMAVKSLKLICRVRGLCYLTVAEQCKAFRHTSMELLTSHGLDLEVQRAALAKITLLNCPGILLSLLNSVISEVTFSNWNFLVYSLFLILVSFCLGKSDDPVWCFIHYISTRYGYQDTRQKVLI